MKIGEKLNPLFLISDQMFKAEVNTLIHYFDIPFFISWLKHLVDILGLILYDITSRKGANGKIVYETLKNWNFLETAWKLQKPLSSMVQWIDCNATKALYRDKVQRAEL